ELLKEIERAERGRPEKCRTPRHYPTLGSLAINPRAGGSWRQYQGTSRRRSRSLASHPLMALSSGMNLRKIRFMMMLFGCGANVGFERNGLLEQDPSDICASMLDHMKDAVRELAPRVAEWLKGIEV